MMNTAKRIIILVIANIAVLSIHAEDKTTIRLSDGSSLIGKIIVQRPGIDITIATESASFVVDDAQMLSKKQKKVKYENLPREWKRWALTEKALQGNANGRYLILYEIRTKNYLLTDVAKVEHSDAPKISYDNIIPNTYKIKWKDVSAILKETVNIDGKPFVEDEITTNSGKTYQGFIVSQRPGDKIAIKTKKNTVDLKWNEISETRKISSSKSFKVYDIVGYTNTVVLKDGTTKSGVITVQHYGKKEKDQYITLLYANGEKENILSGKISEYRTDYQNDSKAPYSQDNVYVNEFRIKPAITKLEDGNTYYTDKKVFPFPEGIVITFKSLGAKFQEAWNLIALDNMLMKDGSSTQGFSPKTRESNSIKPSTTDLSDNVSSISFTYLSPGFYALVNESSSETYVIKIVK